MQKRKLLTIVQLLFVAAVFVVAALKLDFKSVFLALLNSNPFYVVLSFLTGLATFLLLAWRLKTTFSVIRGVPFWKMLSVCVKGKLYAYFFPGQLGFDLSSILQLKKHLNEDFSVAVIFYLDRIVSFFSVSALIFLTLPFAYRFLPPAMQRGAGIIAGAAFVLVVMLVLLWLARGKLLPQGWPQSKFWEKNSFLLKIQYLIINFHMLKYRILKAFVLGLVMNANIQLSLYFLFRAVGVPVDLFYVLAVLPLNSFVMMLPVTLGGIGLKEGGMFFLLKPYGVALNDVVAVSLIGYSFEAFVILAAAALILRDSCVPVAREAGDGR